MTAAALVALLLLEAKHFLFDFVLQSPYQAKNKGVYGHPGGILHAALHVLGTAVVMVFFLTDLPLLLVFLIAEFLIHYHTDWAKAHLVKRSAPARGAEFWSIFGFDQFVHHATYAAIVFAALSS
ncbi:DUF3307 domain-containing protein [Devosia nitrariae]|uniref:DUF3307 domain-containing protein n=1 Tax=Devosia nitrariae TaxID=2071872 RepID=A0ABQ5W1I4_9HYPH|nr:DUF3307 domain-containing protein [Devosia nitrariae]GLQ53863.1 hypothetical protein GCM10010862_11220 [Devosia nitrariae]